MKFMSYTCLLWEVDSKKKWLTDVVGVTIFKVVEPDIKNNKQFMSVLAKIIFYVPDEELETVIKLKYPPNTFEYLMA